MEVHEIENLIPIPLLKLVVGEKRMSIYDKIHNMEFGDTFLKYFDFKKVLGSLRFVKLKKIIIFSILIILTCCSKLGKMKKI